MSVVAQYDKNGNRAEPIAEVYRGIAIREDEHGDYFVELFYNRFTFPTVYEVRKFLDTIL